MSDETLVDEKNSSFKNLTSFDLLVKVKKLNLP